eukprot:EG_transcript_4951
MGARGWWYPGRRLPALLWLVATAAALPGTVPTPLASADCTANLTGEMVAVSGHDFGALGDFERCVGLPGAKYCTVKQGPPLRSLTIGVCVPTTCATHDVPRVLTDHFRLPLRPPHATHCHTDPPPAAPFPFGQAVVVLLYTGLAVCCTVGTVEEWRHQRNEALECDATPLLPPVAGPGDGADIQRAGGCPRRRERDADGPLGWRVFAAQRTLRRLASPLVAGPTHCLNALRAVAMLWVILAHTLYFSMDVQSIRNKEEVQTKILPSFFFVLVPTADLAVDAFFWLSGFLSTTHLQTFMEASARRWDGDGAGNGRLMRGAVSWVLVVVDRYLRLMPLYGLLLLTYWQWLPRLGSGPLWPRVQEIVAQCDAYWWSNLLFINNFVPKEIDRSCMSWTWYLANDLQFSLLAPLLVLLYRRHRWLGLAVTAFLLAGSLHLNWVYYFGDPFKERPYCRIPPYIYGMWTAFLLPPGPPAKGEDPDTPAHRLRRALHDPTTRRAVYAAAAGLMGSTVVLVWYGFAGWLQGHYLPLPVQRFAAVYQRAVWGPGLTLLLLPSLLGCDDCLQPYLQCRGWACLARLTYAAYLVHPLCMMLYFGNGYNSPVFTRLRFLSWLALFTFLSYAAAGGLYVLCEGPMLSWHRAVRRRSA